jgi:predicted RNA-binding Zn-ribbon protein involved in translation (DUF1610 family)
MTGKEYIEYRIKTGSRFLASLHEDTLSEIGMLLEAYVNHNDFNCPLCGSIYKRLHDINTLKCDECGHKWKF